MIEKTDGSRAKSADFDRIMMTRCIALSAAAIERGELPFAGIVCRGEEVIAQATNEVVQGGDITRHAELVAISKAQIVLGQKELAGCTLYSNVEPCAMCAFAARETRIERVVFSIRSPMMGGLSKWNVLRDSELSGAMPEVFGPVPEVVGEFMRAEAVKIWQSWHPLIWTMIKQRGYLDGEEPDPALEHLDAIPDRRSLIRRIFALHRHGPSLLRKFRL
jgi:tRNA(adenine34) deaminase